MAIALVEAAALEYRPRGTIELPLVGLIWAGGLSEDAVAAETDDKLKKYMYQPEATVFVDE